MEDRIREYPSLPPCQLSQVLDRYSIYVVDQQDLRNFIELCDNPLAPNPESR